MTLDVDVSASFSADGAAPFEVDVDVSVADGETLVVLGPSGSGKTLLLELLAGFHDHDGSVAMDGDRLSDRPPEDRNFGFVFQDYALFPHMTVRENVAFGTRYRSETRQPEQLLADLGVGDLVDRSPRTLSGGEQQRVALARSLAVDPEVLLLDEPIAALDVPTRQSLRDDLETLLAGMTAVYVTHNRTTARALADRIAVMADGAIVQVGTPTEVFDQPASPLVARFTGSNCLPLDAVPALREVVEAGTGTTGSHAAIRPETIELDAADPILTGTVDAVTREDATSRVRISLSDTTSDREWTVDVYCADPPTPGTTVGLTIPSEAISLC